MIVLVVILVVIVMILNNYDSNTYSCGNIVGKINSDSDDLLK